MDKERRRARRVDILRRAMYVLIVAAVIWCFETLVKFAIVKTAEREQRKIAKAVARMEKVTPEEYYRSELKELIERQKNTGKLFFPNEMPGKSAGGQKSKKQ
jgi:hypothetical protein